MESNTGLLFSSINIIKKSGTWIGGCPKQSGVQTTGKEDYLNFKCFLEKSRIWETIINGSYAMSFAELMIIFSLKHWTLMEWEGYGVKRYPIYPIIPLSKNLNMFPENTM